MVDDEDKIKNLEDKINDLQQSNIKSKIKDQSLVLVLSIAGFFGLLGISYLYLGKIKKGFVLLVYGLITDYINITIHLINTTYVSKNTSFLTLLIAGIILTIIYLVIVVHQIIDSRKLCKEYNEFMLKTGKSLW